ncbi:response regulator [Luteolibacter ambystomatis]|uniref:Response regulator n=1 Tax=Luteolibacter ambystomatis TaxID=2824561 RepID=A0A975G683_9BACT|nr:response regulator [Luteolibacter ambystomatis]QUE49538.1 response regulator [Luteolibacter ambystomatis]
MPDPEQYDYQRYAILFVDDEEKTRKYFRRLFGDKFRILEAGDGIEALDVFRRHASEIGIIVTDQRMPNETGVGFLSKIAGDYPDIIKILSTAFSDIDAAIGSVNDGGIFRYITKPWDIPQLEVTLRRAMEFFSVKRERDALLSAKMQAMGNVLMSSRLAAFALAPVCAGIKVHRAGEAVASFIKIGVSGRGDSGGDAGLRSPDWAKLHDRQVELASALENELPAALKVDGLSSRTEALAAALETAGARISVAGGGEGSRLSSDTDPTPGLIDVLLGRSDDSAATKASVKTLAALMSIYDAGGSVRRVRGAGLTLDVGTAPAKPTGAAGTETARWLFDDDLLISSALGLI